MSSSLLTDQQDYLHLARGLAWLFFASLAAFGGWRRGEPLASRWLQAAALLLAIGQWLHVLNASYDAGSLQNLDLFVFIVLPLVALLEFSRTELARAGKRVPGAWIHLPWLGAALLLGWGAQGYRQTVALALLALPAALGSGCVLIRANVESAPSAAWRKLAGWTLGLYVASLAWAVPFTGVTGGATAWFVVGRTLVAWSFLVAAVLQHQRETLPSRANLGPGLRTWLASGWVLLAWTAVLLGGGVLTELAARSRVAVLRQNLLNRAELAEAALNPEWLTRLSASTNDLTRPEYHELKARLTALREANTDCRFIYVLKLAADHAVFYADSESPASRDYSPPGELDEADPTALEELRRGESRVSGPAGDRWGIWVSSFVPVRATGDSRVLGVLGFDINARAWKRQIAQARLVPVSGTLLVSLLLLSFSIGYQKSVVAAAQLAASERRYRQAFEGNPAVMVLIAPQTGEVLAANPAARAFYRVPSGETRGRTKAWDFSVDSPELIQEQICALAAGKMSFFSARHRVGPDDIRDVEVCAGPVDTADGPVLHCIIQDVTERRRAEAELRHRETVLAGVAEAGQLLLSGLDTDASVIQALGALGKAIGADRAYVFENHTNPATGDLLSSQRFEWTNGKVSAQLDNPALQSLPIGTLFPRWTAALAGGNPVQGLVKDLDAVERALLDPQDVRSLLIFPIQVRDRFWGFVGFDDCHAPRIWSRAEVDALRAMAGPIGNAILRAREAAALRQREQELRAADRLQSIIINTAATSIFTVDAVGRITSVNEAFCATTGWQRDEVIGQPCSVLDGDPCREGCGLFDPVRRERILHLQCTLHTRDGRRLTVIKNAELLHNDQGEVTGGVESFVDVTDLISVREEVERANRELRVLNQTLAGAVQEARAASAAKSDFLANMSHEIRTPMNAVIGMSSLLRDTALTPRQEEFVEAIRASGEALLEIINEILDFSKIESSTLALETGNFDLRALVDGVLELLAPRALEKSLELVAILQPDVPVGLRGDDGRLRQILVNLIGNGIKFTERGEVVLRVRCLARHPGLARLHFEVSDTGIGIAPEVQPRLFRPFTQADSTTTRQYGGTGLGLAICKRLVELMDGRIGLASAPGRGSSFWFEVELETTPAPEPPPLLRNLTAARLLVVDSHAAGREALWTMLQSWDLAWTEAADGATALELLRAAAAAAGPTILIVDQRLHDMSGLELARRAADITAAARIVLLTQLDAEPSVLAAPGIVAHLAKPVKQSQLFNALLTALAGPTGKAAGDTDFARKPAVANTVPANLRILVAEDHDINRRLAMLMLERLGYRPDFVCDGREVIESWERFSYDVIFMDCQMPFVDGYEATREIRRREALRPADAPARVHIIAMTAHAMQGDREKCLAAGMDDYISKPIRAESLQDALKGLGKRPSVRTAVSGGSATRTPSAASPKPNRIAGMVEDFGPEAAAELLHSFLADTPVRLAELRSLAAGADQPVFARAAHSLAGSCSVFGLDELSALALQLEAGALAAERAACDSLITQLNGQFAAIRPWLEARLAEIKPTGGPPAERG